MIAQSLRTIVPQLTSDDRILVVADNCTDATAAIATTEGAEVIERADRSRRGKGYALDFGMRHLEKDPPEIVIIIDGDCEIAQDAIALLATSSMRHNRPAQALYLMRASSSNSVTYMLRVALFAWTVKNLARPLGLKRWGFPCQLMGTGMAFPWQCIRSASLASGHLVEDMKLGSDLVRSGWPPLFTPTATVVSSFPESSEAIKSQRTRWEHGHLTVITDEVPSLLWHSIVHRSAGGLALALDLLVPPLSSLLLLIAALIGIDTLFWMLTGRSLPLIISGTAAVLAGIALSSAWVSFGRE